MLRRSLIALSLAGLLLFSILFQSQILPSIPAANADHAEAEFDFVEPVTKDDRIALDFTAHSIAVNNETNMLYVTQGDPSSNVITVIDGSTGKKEATIQLPVDYCSKMASPTSPEIAVNSKTNTIYHSCYGTVYVISGDTNTIVEEIPIGASSSPVFVNSISNKVYVLDGYYVYVIDGRDNSVEDTLALCGDPAYEECMADTRYSDVWLHAVDPDKNLLYLTATPHPFTALTNVLVLDLTSREIVGKVEFGFSRETMVTPTALAVDTKTGMIYFGALGGGTASTYHLYVIDGSSYSLVYDIQDVFKEIDGVNNIVANPERNLIYVGGRSTYEYQEVLVVDASSYTVTGHIFFNTGGGIYSSLGTFNPTTNIIYYLHPYVDYISAVDVSEFFGSDKRSSLEGDIIFRPLLMATDHPPAAMTPGRTTHHLVNLENIGTATGQFIIMTTFNPVIEAGPSIDSAFKDIELLYAENNIFIYATSVEPGASKGLGIPVTVPPGVVQFEGNQLQEDKLRIGDQFYPSLTIVLGTLRSEDWKGLKENFEGIKLVAEALKKSFLEEDEFIRNLKSPVVEKCDDGQDNDFDNLVDEDPCKSQDGLTQEADTEFLARLENTRNAAPALAYYVEIIMQAIDRSNTTAGDDAFVPASIELPKESYKLSSSHNEYFPLFPEAYAQRDFVTWRIMSLFVCPGIEFALGGISGIVEGSIPLNLVKFSWNGKSGTFEAGKEMAENAEEFMDIVTGPIGIADILVEKIEDEAKSYVSGEALSGEIFPEGVVRINVPSVLAAAAAAGGHDIGSDPALSHCVSLVGAIDPNHLYANPPEYLADDKRIQFTAMFENLANATAPAYDVKVQAFLDENLDLDTFTNDAVSTPDKLSQFTLDKEKREAIWFFDELTLPPNKNPPEGEGWVKFSVEPKANLNTGTILNNKARIFFDFNPPIDTNVVEHTVDRDAPSTKMKALGSEMPKEFELEWEGSDKGSGIRYVTILAQKEGDQFEAIDITSQSRIQFTGDDGSKYNFISIATDKAGNVEINPLEADTSTLIKTSGGGGCLIATAAFGSELTPQVQFLRNFRDSHILSTTAGSSFMNVFNAWYYSFSPSVADYERQQPWLQQTIKAALYPLLGILGISEKAYSLMPGNIGSMLAGLSASAMIGAVYFSPMALAVKKLRRLKFDYKLASALLGALAVVLAIITLLSNDTGIMMASTTGFILTTLSLGPILVMLTFSKAITFIQALRHNGNK